MLCGSAFKNKGVQAMLDAVIDYMPSPIDIAAGEGHQRRRRDRGAGAEGRRAVLGARVQDHDRPVRRPADLFPRLFGRGALGRHGLQPGQGPQGAPGPHPADARQRPRGDQGSVRRRHRGGGGPEGLHDRRHADDAGEDHHAREDGVSRAGDPRRGRAEDQGRPGKDGHRAESPGAGGSVVPRAHRRGIRADHHLRAWASCTSRSSSTA